MLKLFIFWLALLPFVVWNGSYEGPKIFYLLSGATFLVLFWILRVFRYKKDFDFSKADYLFLVWLVILFISSLLGVHPFESIVGGSYRHQGVIFFLSLWLIGKTVGILNIKEKALLIKSIGASVLIECGVVISQFLFGHLYFGKALGTLGEANAVAGLIAIGSYFVSQSFPKIFLIIPAISIISELSRSGLISFVPNLLVFFEKSIGRLPKYILFLIFGISIILVLVFSVTKNPSPFESRLLFWKMATQEIVERPVLGFGAESGEVIYNEAFQKAQMPLNNLIVDRAHNLFLDAALWSGVIGLLIFSGWLYQSFVSIKDFGKKAAFISFLLYSIFQPLSVAHWILLIIIVNI